MRLLDAAVKAWVAFETIIEPVILAPEADQQSGHYRDGKRRADAIHRLTGGGPPAFRLPVQSGRVLHPGDLAALDDVASDRAAAKSGATKKAGCIRLRLLLARISAAARNRSSRTAPTPSIAYCIGPSGWARMPRRTRRKTRISVR